jgi:hypothetical protein
MLLFLLKARKPSVFKLLSIRKSCSMLEKGQKSYGVHEGGLKFSASVYTERCQKAAVYLVKARVEVDYLHEDRKDAVYLEDARKAAVYLVEARVEVDYLHEDRKDAVYLEEARVEFDYPHEDRKDAVHLVELP